ncbi:MAG TPA: hypothetical protein VEQ11_15260 [Chloroflexota bacterium]|nr:hypothetical protein [Chloroflexota bacterium]
MTIIADKDRQTIQEMLDTQLAEEVELLLFTRPRSRIYVPGRKECQTCDETRELLEELVGLSDKLSLQTHDLATEPEAAAGFNVTEVPTVLVRAGRKEPDIATHGDQQSAATPPTVRFVGLPGGYEFSTLLADLVDLSKGETGLSEATREAVRAVDRPVHIQVFVTPT